MCRSIKRLRPVAGRPEPGPTDDEIQAAALQFVRKVSGFRTPSRRHQETFEAAVAEVAEATRDLLARLDPSEGANSP